MGLWHPIAFFVVWIVWIYQQPHLGTSYGVELVRRQTKNQETRFHRSKTICLTNTPHLLIFKILNYYPSYFADFGKTISNPTSLKDFFNQMFIGFITCVVWKTRDLHLPKSASLQIKGFANHRVPTKCSEWELVKRSLQILLFLWTIPSIVQVLLTRSDLFKHD